MEDGLIPGARCFSTDYNHKIALVVCTGVSTCQVLLSEDAAIALAADLARLAKKLNK